MAVLTADSISSGYGRMIIVRDVSLEVEAGRITAIVGPNGAGKSTFAKTVAGLLQARSGRIHLAGKELTGLPGHLYARHGLAYVPQNDNVFRTMTVRENLEIGGFVLRGDLTARLDAVLAAFPALAEALDKKAGNLSGGQQNLLAMARALMARPSVIVLDEPTAGLSPAYTSVVWEQVEAVAAQGTAVLVIEQNVERALAHAHQVHVLVAGANHVHGPAEEIAALDLGSLFLGHTASESHPQAPNQ
jgi:ABC-type branched-subunit amino acid transport system ATPase component